MYDQYLSKLTYVYKLKIKFLCYDNLSICESKSGNLQTIYLLFIYLFFFWWGVGEGFDLAWFESQCVFYESCVIFFV